MSKFAFIWDLDGTLVNSYPAIVPSAMEVCREIGLELAPEDVHDFVIRTSVRELLKECAAKQGVAWEPLWKRFNRYSDGRIGHIEAMPHAIEALAALQARGWPSFVYTHRGASTDAILQQTGLAPYLTEVLTADSGFPRKPEPDAILHLMEKYRLSPDTTWYVGDRSLDIEAAVNAGIQSILYLPHDSPGAPTGNETFLVADLLEIPELFQ